jgi:hypothetical protein
MADRPDPQARLAELADAGRVRREAAAAAEQQAADREAAEQAAAALRHQRLMSYTTWASLSSFMRLLYWAPFLPLLAFFVAQFRLVSMRFVYGSLIVSGVFVLLALGGALVARRQDIRFRAALPFAISGYEQVLGRPARTVRCRITFVAAVPPPQMFSDLFHTLRDPTKLTQVEETELVIEASAREYSLLDEHCRWMPRWFRALNRSVLQPVHAVYPIRSITFS